MTGGLSPNVTCTGFSAPPRLCQVFASVCKCWADAAEFDASPTSIFAVSADTSNIFSAVLIS
jgi:hypothetical protein